MQAIQTKYLGPTNTRDSRIKASCQAGSLTMSYDHRLNLEENHREAARQLILRRGWYGRWAGGVLPAGDYAFVCSQRVWEGGKGCHEGFDVWEGMTAPRFCTAEV